MSAMKRREFIGALSASAFMSIFGLDARAGERKLRFGVISDIHVGTGGDDRDSKSATRFRRALEYFRDREVDAVMIAGDLTEMGFGEEMQLVADTWFSVFPNDCGADGRKVERLFTTGNHDFVGYSYRNRDDKVLQEKYKARSMSADPAGFWERYWHEPYSNHFVKTVKGYTFVFSHCFRWGGLDSYLRKLKLDRDRPFFYCMHYHPRDTVYALPVTTAEASVTKTLSRYPNAIVFSGHSHRPLNDPSSVWQGAFTSIATGAVSQIFAGSEVAHENCTKPKGDRTDKRVEEMPRMRLSGGAVTTLVDVYEDRIVLESRSLVHDCKVREDLVLPLPACRDDASRPYRFAPRRQTDLPPRFPANAVLRILDPDKPGKNRNGQESWQTIVSFPRAQALSGGLRDYEIVVEKKAEGEWVKVCERRIFAQWFYLPEQKAEELMRKDRLDEQCVLARSLLPQNATLRYRVTAFDFWGKRGDTLEALRTR